MKGDIEAVQDLLDRGASPDARGPDGSGPALYWAACGGHEQVVELLLIYGANPNGVSDFPEHDTALQCANRNGHIGIEISLRKRCVTE